jgi:ligand-binding sensor protein
VQAVQDIFAEVSSVGAVTTHPTGQPITEVSHSCRFCHLILSNPSGRQACIDSWANLVQVKSPHFAVCHAGLKYAAARIEIDNTVKAQMVAGQFYTESPNPLEERARIKQLAKKHGLDETALQEAAAGIPVRISGYWTASGPGWSRMSR